MMEYAEEKHPPEPPPYGAYFAVALELGILATFALERSIAGLVLCCGYAWFSATWQALAGGFDGKPKQ